MAHFLSPLVSVPGSAWVLTDAASGAAVATHVVTAFDSAKRRTGLLGTAAWPEGSALVIAPTQAIHMFGMRYPIDVVWAARDGRVVKAVTVRPWGVSICARAFAAIELPAGAASRAGVGRGTTLVLRPA